MSTAEFLEVHRPQRGFDLEVVGWRCDDGGGGSVHVCGWCCGGDGVFKINFKFIEKFLK